MKHFLLIMGGATIGFALPPINTINFWIGMVGMVLVIFGSSYNDDV